MKNKPLAAIVAFGIVAAAAILGCVKVKNELAMTREYHAQASALERIAAAAERAYPEPKELPRPSLLDAPLAERDGYPTGCLMEARIKPDGRVVPAECLAWAKADAGLVKRYGSKLHAEDTITTIADFKDIGCLNIIQPKSHRQYQFCGDKITEIVP